MKSNFQLLEELSDSAKAELQRRAQINGNNIESEALNIIEQALSKPSQVEFDDKLAIIEIIEEDLSKSSQMGFGDKLTAIGRFYQIEEQDIEFIESMRDRSPAKPMKFD